MNRICFNWVSNKFDNFVRNISISPYRHTTTKKIPQSIKFNIQAPVIYKFAAFLKQFQRFHTSYAPLNINPSSIKSDVIVYKYENPRFFKILNTFGLVQFFVLCYTSESLLHGLKRIKIDEEDDSKLKKNPIYLRKDFSENSWRYGSAIGIFLIGWVLIGVCWGYTLRSVRYLVLRKGGGKVSFVTYGPLGTNRIMDVPLSHVSAVRTRATGGSTIPMKVKKRKFYYLLDSQGEFRQKDLFDYFINVKR